MTKIDISEWKPFAIGNIFDVIKGTRLTKAHMKSGDIRFIGSSSMNNGCTSLVGNTENMHSENTITVCYNGSVGETFYQDEPFLASDDVNVLYPKFNMNRNIALFIAPLIKAISARYNYVDKWKNYNFALWLPLIHALLVLDRMEKDLPILFVFLFVHLLCSWD